MKYALVSLFLFAQTALACRCDFSGIKALEKNPASAATAVTGIVESNGDIQELRVERSWRKQAKVIPLGSVQSSCSLGLKTGKRYLVLSFQSIEAMQRVPANICQAFAIELEKATDIIKQLTK